ncbi:MAG: hypothetical protein B0D91_06230 [Oceanospirillales bacterium LUC14_002_19_P2]|nr:MAG: hypothetical protein B0D91_06230 [Oceanospirillales bacterium LUC14_002_19_P2]
MAQQIQPGQAELPESLTAAELSATAWHHSFNAQRYPTNEIFVQIKNIFNAVKGSDDFSALLHFDWIDSD